MQLAYDFEDDYTDGVWQSQLSQIDLNWNG